MKRKRKSNGQRAVNDRKSVTRARGRVLSRALKQGAITNEEARQVMGLSQVWYHLHRLAKAGVLRRTGYDTWSPIRRRGRPIRI